MVVVQAYVDDSRSDVGEQRLVLAGYINTADNWARFSDSWYSELRRAPAIDYMKMVEAAGLNGQFWGWSEKDRDHKVADLARIIRHFHPVSIHSSVSQRLVREIIRPVAPYGMGSPYSLCFDAIIVPLAISQSRQPGLMQVPIDFVFDDQEGLGEESRRLYQAVRAQQPSAVKKVLSEEPLFRDDKLVMPLQAADMLAWHVRRHFEHGDPDAFPVPEFLSADDRHTASDIPEWYLQRMADQFKAIPGAASLSGKGAWKKYRREVEKLGIPAFPTKNPFAKPRPLNRARRLFARLAGK